MEEHATQEATPPRRPPCSSCGVMVLALDAVVMEMEKLSASGTVTMEISIAAAAAAAAASVEESAQHHGQLPSANHRMLVVVGETSTSQHLDAVRKQIGRGETKGADGLLRATPTGCRCQRRVFGSPPGDKPTADSCFTSVKVQISMSERVTVMFCKCLSSEHYRRKGQNSGRNKNVRFLTNSSHILLCIMYFYVAQTEP